MASEEKRKAVARYNAQNLRRIIFDINVKTYPKMFAWLTSQPSRQAYLKRLIAKDMVARGIDVDEQANTLFPDNTP